MKTTHIITLTACLLLSFSSASLRAQLPSYHDVAVIVNDSSAESIAIGNYYAQRNGISPNRILHISTPVQHAIDSVTFRDLQAQVEAALIAGNLLDTVNYLVTTKGMPVQVSKAGACDSVKNPNTQAAQPYIGKCSCVDAELTMILSPIDSMILVTNQFAGNPYSDANQAFDRDSFGVFIVSRLDGLTQADIFAMIDRSGPASYDTASATSLLDHFNLSPLLSAYFNGTAYPYYVQAVGPLSLNYIMDTVNATFVTGKENVVYNEYTYGAPVTGLGHVYAPGAVVHGILESSYYGPAGWEENQVLRQIKLGATGAMTYTSLHYSGTAFIPTFFGERYLHPDSTQHRFTLGEAALASQAALGTQNMLIGDPKTTLIPGYTPIQSIPQPSTPFDFALFPNPSNGQEVQLQSLMPGRQPVSLRIIDALGRVVQVGTLPVQQDGMLIASMPIGTLSPGTYLISLRQGTQRASKPLVVLR